MKNRRLIIGLSAVIAVLGLVLVFFAFGTPQGPVLTGTQGNAGSTAVTGEAPPPDPSSPLTIEIPGCVCHSDDPKVVEEHAGYRMNQCFGCHADGMPEMGG